MPQSSFPLVPPQSATNPPSRPIVRSSSPPALQAGRLRSDSDSSRSEYSTRTSKSVTNLRRMVQPRVSLSSVYAGNPSYPPMSPYPEYSKSKGSSEAKLKYSQSPAKSSKTTEEENFGQERPLPQLSNRVIKALPQKKHRGNKYPQHPVEAKCTCAPDHQLHRAVEEGEPSRQNSVRKSIAFTSHSLPLPNRRAANTARARTTDPEWAKESAPIESHVENGHTLDNRASSSRLVQPSNSTRGLKPVFSAYELRSKPASRNITPTDSVMEGLGSSESRFSQRQNTVVKEKSGKEEAQPLLAEPRSMTQQDSTVRTPNEPQQSQDTPPPQTHISFPPFVHPTLLPPRPSPRPSSPPAPKASKKSFRKSLGSSIGRSRRHISGLFGLMTREGPQSHVKTVDEAMAKTALYLNGFSKMSAFTRDYNSAMLRELDDVQARYRGFGRGGGEDATREEAE